MKKERVEFLSDAVFSIVMTLLVVQIKVPELEHISDAQLVGEIVALLPLFVGYFVSFSVVSMYWMSHHALFHFFTKKVDRALMYLNMLLLLLISMIPFSAHFIGQYPDRSPAIIFYGVNLVLLGLVGIWMFYHVVSRVHLAHPDLTKRTIKQAKIRQLLTPSFAVLGIIFSFISIPVSLILFAFPIVFNLIPGTLNFAERVFRFEL